ncbi:UDP-N-acetylmuramoyl-tripeptide--D-alanyl-D-alanine ligase [Pseudoalteromonas xiamenensis]|uniref:UDP-N-acetylmuramoyl-tripeptide--D-alanyl-D- alanine ligase n=1 Tax=Pseudoalteromonas xiamenensis TaxID=882626 RepID=UPI0027E563EE|nr:UDP-N-acetylmuramoyl-tripeptide--D-alanyl-D-alanine ligase [Pseudoalteromonas xiamenensis]WMN61237.1 UDP-N-acetylmuramoyl-tripeptide--D-alanyl-D-alanine ligase [Pseudoalteromonas xiamenensis]
MIAVDLNWIANVLNTDKPAHNLAVHQISTDTRSVRQGDVFVALQGEQFDAHDFVAQAVENGAIGVVVSKLVDVNIPQFLVADTKLALGELGKAVMSHVQPKTIAITGSVGKTTVKEMCAAILRQKGKVLATAGNFNNEIGVPLTLLRLSEEDEFAVIELGANHIGEIAYTVSLTQPDVATVCNVAPAHIEGFGSIDGVGQAKGEIFTGLKATGTALFNEECPYIVDWYHHLSSQSVVKFHSETPSDFYPTEISLDALARASFTLNTPDGTIRIQLPLSGRHNVINAVIAAALTSRVGASLDDIMNGLMQMAEVKGRVNVKQVNAHLTVIDDSYNANVKSVKAAIDLLADLPTHQVLVLGDMGELGPDAAQYHSEIGEYAKQKAIPALFALGPLSRSYVDAFGPDGQHFTTREALLQTLKNYLEEQQKEITVLVKGSRSARMELVADELVSESRHGKEGVVSC